LKFESLTHQKLIHNHLIENEVAAIFAGMGLGKTSGTLSALNYLFADGVCNGVLIVAPLRVAVLTWSNEIEKWDGFRWMRVANLRTKAGQKAWVEKSADVYLINYESLPTFTKKFIAPFPPSAMPANTIIFDELTKAKNPNSKRINYFRKFIARFPRRIGLTGTPVPNSQLDLFAQIRLLDDGKRFGKFFGHYRSQYFSVIPNPYSNYEKYVLRQGSETLIESKIADMTLTLTSEDWLDIPPTTFEDIEVTLPKDAEKLYKKLEKDLLVTLENDYEMVAVNAAVLTRKLLQVTGGAVYVQVDDDKSSRKIEHVHNAKIDALKKLYKDEGEEPLLVACQFRHEISRIIDQVDGAVEFSEDKLADWNAGKIKMLVTHPASAGHGLMFSFLSISIPDVSAYSSE